MKKLDIIIKKHGIKIKDNNVLNEWVELNKEKVSKELEEDKELMLKFTKEMLKEIINENKDEMIEIEDGIVIENDNLNDNNNDDDIVIENYDLNNYNDDGIEPDSDSENDDNNEEINTPLNQRFTIQTITVKRKKRQILRIKGNEEDESMNEIELMAMLFINSKENEKLIEISNICST